MTIDVQINDHIQQLFLVDRNAATSSIGANLLDLPAPPPSGKEKICLQLGKMFVKDFPIKVVPYMDNVHKLPVIGQDLLSHFKVTVKPRPYGPFTANDAIVLPGGRLILEQSRPKGP